MAVTIHIIQSINQSINLYVCMYIRLKQLTNRNIDNTDNKRKSKR